MDYKKHLKDNIYYDKTTGEYSLTLPTEISDVEKVLSPISICWMIENACNLNCIYCFAEHKNLHSSEMSYKEIADHILSFNPTTIILTGGEPTLNKNIKDILDYINDKAITIIDSNGTCMSFEKLIPYLNNSVVRFSIDSLNTEVLAKVRPSKIESNTKNQIPRISNNIKVLTSNNIPVIIQTVMTKYNVYELDEIHKFLVENGIKRWYLSAVKYSEKCKDDYSDIGLTDAEIDYISGLVSKYNDLYVTFSLEKDAGANSRLFVEKSGKFFVDTITDGIEYVGENPFLPTQEEIYNKLNCEEHYNLYIKKKNLVKRNKR